MEGERLTLCRLSYDFLVYTTEQANAKKRKRNSDSFVFLQRGKVYRFYYFTTGFNQSSTSVLGSKPLFFRGGTTQEKMGSTHAHNIRILFFSLLLPPFEQVLLVLEYKTGKKPPFFTLRLLWV